MSYPWDQPIEKKVTKVTKSPLGDKTEHEIVIKQRREMVAGVPSAIPVNPKPVAPKSEDGEVQA